VSVTAAYNGASQLSTLNYGGYGPLVNSGYYGTSTFTETRTYNTLMQLTGLTNGLASEFYSATMVNMQYNYTAGQNNGRVAQTVDSAVGETVNYTYDVWNRLTTASATNGNWGEQYTFDNFSNLTGKTSTAGSAPSMSVSVNPANNQPTGLGSYDANGNPVGNTSSPAYVWNVENRLATNQTSASQPITYIYDPWGRRVWSQNNYSSGSTGEIYFYGATGQKLETYSFTIADSLFNSSLLGINTYFGGKLLQSKGIWVATDKLGSVRANANPAVPNGEVMNYWPYGEERTTTANDREKFAGYMRDAVGQDYAMARYYNSNMGAFWSPDPGGISTAKPSNPTSWNRYAHTNGDPINFGDPTGKIVVACDDPDAQSIYDGSCDLVGGGEDAGGGGGNNCGGNQFEPAPDPSCYADVPPPEGPPSPSCSLSFDYRGYSGISALASIAAHGYLYYTAADNSTDIIEGVQVSQGGGAPLLQTTAGPTGYAADNPSTNPSAGAIAGPQVCNWFATILSAATQIDQADIPYNARGPNSNSALGYILSQLPSSSWYTVPYYVIPVYTGGGVHVFTFGLIGYYTPLPGLN